MKENEEVEKLEALCREVEEMLPVWKMSTDTVWEEYGSLTVIIGGAVVANM